VSRYLRVKLRRDLRRHWRQFVAVLLMAFLSVLVYTGLEGAWNGLRQHLDAYAADTALADVWLAAVGVDDALVDRVAAVEGVRAVEAVEHLDAAVTLPDDDAHLVVELVPAASGTLSLPSVVDGAASGPEDGGFWLGAPFAEAQGIAVGDVVALTAGGWTTDVVVAGTYLSSERLYFTGTPALVAPAPELYGYAMLPADDVPDAGVVMSSTVRVATDGSARTSAAVADEVGDRLLRLTDRTTNDAVATAYDRVDQIRDLSVLFSFIFVLLAVLAMYSSMRRLVEMQTREVATLKALGVGSREIAAHFAMYGLVTGGIGAVLGMLVAPAMSRYVLGTQQSMVSMPDWGIAYTPVPLAVAVLVTGVCVGGAALAARPALRGVPAEQLRPGVARGRRVLLERARWFWRRSSYGSRWAWRDSGANPVRFGMGVVALAGSLMLLFAGFGMADSMHGQVRSAFVEENRYETRVALAPGAPLDELRGVVATSQLVQESLVRTTPSDGFDRVLTIVDVGEFLHLTTLAGDRADLDLVTVTDATARRLGVDVGDEVVLALPAGAGSVAVAVEQVVHGSAPQGFTVSRAVWESWGREFAPTALLTDNSVAPTELRGLIGVTDVLRLEAQRANATAMVEDLGGIFLLIRVFAVLLAIIVLYSLGALAFAERVRDYATLRVLGFGTRELRLLAARENVVATALGLVVGVPVGLWFLSVYVGTFSTPRMEYTPQISTTSVTVAVAIAAGFSLLTTALLGRRIRGVDMVGALKGVE
jgi:putative ABC transport system permease protein